MRVLVVGAGGREHALCWKIAQSPKLDRLICAPGNPGIASVADCRPLEPTDLEAVARLVAAERVDLVVVGPEAPLCAGLTDRLALDGVAVFGPTAAAARLEGSKAFTKRFCERHRIPTGAFAVCEDESAIDRALADRPSLRVAKADGLAGGKGVVVCDTVEETREAARALFGRFGAPVVIEERLGGEELSVLAVSDGARVAILPAAQDFKRVGDGDQGPNTGGMGAVAPVPWADPTLLARVRTEIIEPAIGAMAAEGHPLRGVLYAGLMVDRGAPKLLEFNVRFGDPETEPLMLLIDGDLLGLLEGAARGSLGEAPTVAPGAAAAVVLCASGYPGEVDKGAVIAGVERAGARPGVTVFHAGTARQGAQQGAQQVERLVTSGGRVLCVTASGASLDEALRRAYGAAAEIQFDRMHYRRDIGARYRKTNGGSA